jgi:antitoxin component YwqK of YwqJK toxin-antitoxin module
MNELRVHVSQTTVDEGEIVVYNGAPLTGDVYNTAPNGTVVTAKSYRDGLEEGVQREWYADGRPESEYRVEDNQLVGETLDWHRNGRLARRQVFDEYGQLQAREVWDEEGDLLPDESFDYRSADVTE